MSEMVLKLSYFVAFIKGINLVQYFAKMPCLNGLFNIHVFRHGNLMADDE